MVPRVMDRTQRKELKRMEMETNRKKKLERMKIEAEKEREKKQEIVEKQSEYQRAKEEEKRDKRLVKNCCLKVEFDFERYYGGCCGECNKCMMVSHYWTAYLWIDNTVDNLVKSNKGDKIIVNEISVVPITDEFRVSDDYKIEYKTVEGEWVHISTELSYYL